MWEEGLNVKRFFAILLASLCILTGCNSSDASVAGDDTTTTSNTALSTTEPADSDVVPDGVLVDYESLIYEGTSKIRVSDLCEFEVPEDIAKKCIPIEDAIDKMTAINGTADLEDITPEFWESMFEDCSYFVNYHEVAMLMSEELLLQINLFEADADTSALINVLSDTNDVATFNSIFGKIVVTSLYGSQGFSMLSRAGVIEEDGVTLLSFIYASDTKGFSLTDGYFGYFIVGYSAKTNTLMTCLISGLSGISDPEMVASVYNSFDSPSDDSEYWGILERSTNE